MQGVSTPEPIGPSRLSNDRLALLAKVATMYHEHGIRQPLIAQRLHLSQSRVSRLLKEAVEVGVVRTIVVPPPGSFPDLEERIRARYDLADVVVTDTAAEDDYSLLAALGSSAAAFLETTLSASDRVGISSWSASLLATVDAMLPRPTRSAQEIVQVIGGVGNASAQVKATHLADRLARVTGSTPVYLPAPGIVASALVRDALLDDPALAHLGDAWRSLTTLLAGIGTLTPSPLLQSSGNAISEVDADQLRTLGAVGDVCLRFFDASGALVDSSLERRVVGIGSDELRRVPRKIGVAGGAAKFDAILGAVRGHWVDVLITDHGTARRLDVPAD